MRWAEFKNEFEEYPCYILSAQLIAAGVARRMHAKMIICDARRGLLGSHNLTAGSLYRYDDLGLMFEFAEIALALARYFGELWKAAERNPPWRSGSRPIMVRSNG